MQLIAAFSALPAPVRATLLMCSAMVFFTSMGIFIRLASEHLHVLEVVFFRNFLAVVLMAPWIMRQGLGALRTERYGLYSLRAAINLVAMAAGFAAITMIPLAEATALGFTAPLFATIGAVLVLGEVIRVRRVAALVAGFVGMLIVLRPGMEAISAGALLALGNALGISVTALVVKKLTATERPEAIVLWMVLLQSPLSLVPALFFWTWPDAMTWLWLFCLAGAGTLGHMCWTRACGLAEITQLQPLEFVKLPLIAVMGFLLFGEGPTLWVWLGGAVIFCSTAYISHREAVMARRKAREAAGR
ncbi:DMT family transporter [Nisaea acidiphila]|uniref:DMT family transporter n=1 Tax=Nisaea acidiphila TaxID=1862145 RepID=A0A9J7AN34_9PROT|nr:DMT family transporter [Nisaea acidiphila]UUX47985.1 DMT family transporter [Nisaea acidiphila]